MTELARRILIIASTVAAAASLGACNFDDDGQGTDERASLYERLGTREALSLESTSLIGVAAYDDAGNPLPCLQPSVEGGEAVLRATPEGVLVVEKMSVRLSDLVVESGVVYSEPIHLTDIELRLGTQLAVEPSWTEDDNAASGDGTADLLMDWAVLDDDGDRLPLATQLLRRTDFRVHAYLGDDRQVHLELLSSIDGRVAGFGNRVELSDFAMVVNAASTAAIE